MEEPIDLLYLDAWDVGTPDYKQRHRDAFLAAREGDSGTPDQLQEVPVRDFTGKSLTSVPLLVCYPSIQGFSL